MNDDTAGKIINFQRAIQTFYKRHESFNTNVFKENSCVSFALDSFNLVCRFLKRSRELSISLGKFANVKDIKIEKNKLTNEITLKFLK